MRSRTMFSTVTELTVDLVVQYTTMDVGCCYTYLHIQHAYKLIKGGGERSCGHGISSVEHFYAVTGCVLSVKKKKSWLGLHLRI